MRAVISIVWLQISGVWITEAPLYTDICGLMQTQSFGGSYYFITFTDDYYSRLYFLTDAFEVSAETALRANRGGKYL